jgi:hypothetical protein
MRATITVCMVTLMLASTGVASDKPHVMNFQARLTDAAGNSIPDGPHGVVFSLYADSTAGQVLWTETQTVGVVSGAFTVLLGSSNPLDPDVFAGASRYIGIKVDGETEITPRTPLGAVPYAFQAGGVAEAAAGAGLMPDTNWVAPYFRAIDGSPVLALTIISIYNADTTSNLVTLSFYSESGSLIDECSQSVAKGGLWLFRSNQGACPNVTNHEGYIKVKGSGPIAPAGVIMTSQYGSPTLAPASATLTFFKL